MPYNRYDIKNKYNNKGKRVNENVGLKTFFLILIPILIVLVIAFGIFLAYRIEVGPLFDDSNDSTADQLQIVTDEELLRVVNDHNRLEADFVPELTAFGDVQVSSIAYNDLDKLVKDASADGVNITVSAGYVSYEGQSVLYQNAFDKIKADGDYSDIRAESETKKVCPEAGCSESQTGLLVKFVTSESANTFAETEAYKWLENNAVNYGFVLRYPEGGEVQTGMTFAPDTFRYVGSEHALNIRRYGMTLDEYSSHVSIR